MLTTISYNAIKTYMSFNFKKKTESRLDIFEVHPKQQGDTKITYICMCICINNRHTYYATLPCDFFPDKTQQNYLSMLQLRVEWPNSDTVYLHTKRDGLVETIYCVIWYSNKGTFRTYLRIVVSVCKVRVCACVWVSCVCVCCVFVLVCEYAACACVACACAACKVWVKSPNTSLTSPL